MKRLFLSAALILIALPVAAADNGFYIGGSVGYSDITTGGDLSSVDISDNANGYKIFAGGRFLHFLGAEGTYADFGTIKDDATATETGIKGYGLQVVAYIPLVVVDIFGKAGVFNSTVDTQTISKSSSEPVYGAGVQFRIKSFAIRGEAELYDVKNADKVYMYSIGASYTF